MLRFSQVHVQLNPSKFTIALPACLCHDKVLVLRQGEDQVICDDQLLILGPVLPGILLEQTPATEFGAMNKAPSSPQSRDILRSINPKDNFRTTDGIHDEVFCIILLF